MTNCGRRASFLGVGVLSIRVAAGVGGQNGGGRGAASAINESKGGGRADIIQTSPCPSLKFRLFQTRNLVAHITGVLLYTGLAFIVARARPPASSAAPSKSQPKPKAQFSPKNRFSSGSLPPRKSSGHENVVSDDTHCRRSSHHHASAAVARPGRPSWLLKGRVR